MDGRPAFAVATRLEGLPEWRGTPAVRLAWHAACCFADAMSIGRLLTEHKQEILARWRLHVGQKLAGNAVDRATLEDGWSGFLDAVARLGEHAGDGNAPLDGSAHGAQRLHLGFDASEMVRETGILHAAIVDIAAERGCALDTADERLLLRCFYAVLATAVGEHGRRRDAAVERETVVALGRLAGELGDDGAALRRLHAWAESRTAWPNDGCRHERFSLAGVLAQAVADARPLASARGVIVLVDLAAPIEVSGARDLLCRAVVRVLRSAIAATRRGGHVVARAQMLSGGRARIDIRDECGGGGVVPAGHQRRPATALGEPRAGASDWALVRGAVSANRGTVHARTLPGVGCLVTIDVPGRGDEAPCCDGEAATGT